jgi:excisionase family DNA binding protein
VTRQPFTERQAAFARTLPKLSELAPDSGPHPLVAHVYSNLDGSGRCVRGKPLQTGIHVAPLPEAAEQVGLSVRMLRNLHDQGRLPFVRVGRRILVRHEDLVRLLGGGTG